MRKKLLAMLLCVAMLLALVPTMAFAATGETNSGATLSGSVYKKDDALPKNNSCVITAGSTYALPKSGTTGVKVTVTNVGTYQSARYAIVPASGTLADITLTTSSSRQISFNGNNDWALYEDDDDLYLRRGSSSSRKYITLSGSMFSGTASSRQDSGIMTVYASPTTGTATVNDATFTYGDGLPHLPAVSDISNNFKVKYAAGTENGNTAPAANQFKDSLTAADYANADTYYVWVGLFYGNNTSVVLDSVKAKVTVNPASIKGETMNVYEKYDGTIQDGGKYVIVIWEEDKQNTANQGYYALSNKDREVGGYGGGKGLDHIKGEVIGGSTFKIDAAATLIPPVWTWNSESGTFSYVDGSKTYYLSHASNTLQVSNSSTNATWSHAAVNDSVNGNHRFSYGTGDPYYLRHSGGSAMFQVRNQNNPETTSAVYLYTYGEKQTIAAAGVVDKMYTGVAYEPGTDETPFSVTDINGKTLVEDKDYTISYYKNTGTKANPVYVVSPEAVTPKDAGSYIMRLTGKGNYNEYQDIPFDITKAPLTITAKDKTIYVGDEAANDGVTYGATDANFVNGENESVLVGTASYEYKTKGDTPVAFDKTTAKAGDTYAIIPSGLSSDNYDITFANGTLTVKSRFDLTYDDTLTAKDTYTSNTEDLIGVTTVTLNLNGGAYDSTPIGLAKVSDTQYTYTVVADTAKDISGASYRPTQTGKVFTGWDKNTTSSMATNIVFDATWEADTLGGATGSDGIPDKYQKLITFKVVNGAWNDDTTDNKAAYVTLLDNDGKWSTSGSGKLTADQIPAVGSKPNTDYKAGAWNTTLTTDTVITVAATYTYTYAQYGTISGTISPADAKVELYKVGEHDPIGTVNDVSETLGFYSFDVSEQGSYNVVVTYNDDVVVTKLVQYAGAKVVQDIEKPSSDVNSELEVNGNTPNMVVGGLDEEAKVEADKTDMAGKTLTVKMEVAGETDSATGAPETKTAAGTTYMDYYDIDVTKHVQEGVDPEVVTQIPETTTLMTIVFPFDFTDKTNVKVMRWHDADEDDDVDNGEIEQLPEGSANANGEGEYVVLDRDNDEITMHVRFFSLYAVGYDDVGYEEPVHYASEYRVNTPETVKDGSVTASRKWASSGKTVKITVKPNKGHSVNVLTVIKQDGTPIALKDTGNGVYTFRMPAADVWVYASFNCPRNETCPIEKFSDTVNDSWWHDGIHYCLANDLMNGFPDGTFQPNGNTTRAQVTAMLWRMAGSPVVDNTHLFTDVQDGMWYAEAIRWAAAENVVKGISETEFAPNAPVTREQLAAMLYRYAQYKGQGFTGAWMFLLDFSDREKVSDWAYEAVCWCSMKGVVTGRTATEFVPSDNATRAEVAAMFQRFCEDALK